MGITVKMNDVLEAVAGMRWLAEQAIPAKAAYTVMKLQRKLDAEIQDFLDMRKAKLHQHGISESGGEEAQVKAFERDMADLLEYDITIEVEKLPWSVLEGLSGITTAHLNSIAPFFDLPEGAP